MTYPGKAQNEKIDALTNQSAPPVDLVVGGREDLAHLRACWSGMDGIPKLVPVRTAGEDRSFLGFDIRTLLRGEESGGRHAVHSIILPPGAEFPAHGLESGDTFWFVLCGEVEITIGARTPTLRAPAFAYAPEQTTQAVANRSAGTAEVYVVHSPAGADCAFADAHRLWRERPDTPPDRFWTILDAYGFGFTGRKALPNDARTNAEAPQIDAVIERFEDFAALRERWSRLAPIPKFVQFPRRFHNITPIPGVETHLILTPEESRGRASVFFNAAAKGMGAPPHHQSTEDEMFIVFSGSMQLSVGARRGDARPGAFGFAPRFGTHTFVGQGEDEMTLFFSLNSPGGHDRGFKAGFREAGAFASERFQALMEAHGFTFHQPFGSAELVNSAANAPDP